MVQKIKSAELNNHFPVDKYENKLNKWFKEFESNLKVIETLQ